MTFPKYTFSLTKCYKVVDIDNISWSLHLKLIVPFRVLYLSIRRQNTGKGTPKETHHVHNVCLIRIHKICLFSYTQISLIYIVCSAIDYRTEKICRNTKSARDIDSRSTLKPTVSPKAVKRCENSPQFWHNTTWTDMCPYKIIHFRLNVCIESRSSLILTFGKIFKRYEFIMEGLK